MAVSARDRLLTTHPQAALDSRALDHRLLGKDYVLSCSLHRQVKWPLMRPSFLLAHARGWLAAVTS